MASKLILLFALAVFVNAQTPPLKETTSLPTDSTTLMPIDKNTTVITTTKATTTTTTTTPETTTPETTTPKTTTPKTTTPSTPAPTTTTPVPSVPFPNNVGNWSVTEKDHTCINVTGAFEINVSYQSGKDKKLEKIVVPANAKASGSCGNDTQTMELKWLVTYVNVTTNETVNQEDSIVLTFKEKEATGKEANFGLDHFTALLYSDKFGVVTGSLLLSDPYQTPLNHSFQCKKEMTLKPKEGESPFTITTASLQFEAFRSTDDSHKTFGEVVNCELDDTTDTVPIVIGALLAGLVVLVLIAYLFGRRRSRARGYQSV